MAVSSDVSSIHKNWLDANEKFDYFLLGVTAAALAYLGEKFVPEPIAFSQNTIELCALLLLCIAFVSSLLRIEQLVTALGINLELLKIQDDQKEIVKALHETSTQIDAKTGEIFDPQVASVKLEVLSSEEKRVREKLRKAGKKSVRLYKIRKWTLVLGFVGIAASKLFQAIATTPILYV